MVRKAVWGLALAACGLTGCMQSYESARAERQAAEANRRAALSPEQRAAEDADRERVASEQAAAAAAANEAERREKWPMQARGACLLAIEGVLHDPGSAKFTQTTTWALQDLPDGTTQVQPKVRAKNGFGAYRFVTYDCFVKPVPAGAQIVSLKQLR